MCTDMEQQERSSRLWKPTRSALVMAVVGILFLLLLTAGPMGQRRAEAHNAGLVCGYSPWTSGGLIHTFAWEVYYPDPLVPEFTINDHWWTRWDAEGDWVWVGPYYCGWV